MNLKEDNLKEKRNKGIQEISKKNKRTRKNRDNYQKHLNEEGK